MNTRHDLESELSRLAAEHAPSSEAIRRDLNDRGARGAAGHRNSAWLAVAAAVVLVVGGIAVTAGVMQPDEGTHAASDGGTHAASDEAANTAPDGQHEQDGADTAASNAPVGDNGDVGAPQPVMIAPGVPLPATSNLVAHRAEAVTSPVSATAPDGLDGREWRQSSEALAVTYFDRDALQQIRAEATANPRTEPSISVPEVGYVITADREGQLATFGSPNAPAPTVTRQPYRIGGHDASLDTAGAMTMDQFGNPARERITWQLADGRWIHVWATKDDGASTTTGSSPSPMLAAFATTITATPQELPFALTIGLTLPGMEHVSRIMSGGLTAPSGGVTIVCRGGRDSMSTDAQGAAGLPCAWADLLGLSGNALVLCRDGYDPLGPAAQGATDPPCVWAELVKPADPNLDPHATMAQGTVVTVAGRDVHVLDIPATDTPMLGAAWADLDNGLRLSVTVPSSAKLSNDDFAALVASVRVSANR